MNKITRYLLGLLILAIVFGLFLVTMINQPVLAQDNHQPANWVILLQRIESSKKVITIHDRYKSPGSASGIISELGDDYLCLNNNGTSICYPFDSIGTIETPPGTFGDTEPGK